MSVAALEALAMRDCLAVGTSRLAGRFFNRASKAVDIAWTITVGNDLWSSNDPASRKLPARVINWYLAKMQVAARHDPELSLAFLHVGNLTAAPPTLLRPRLALRVLRENLRASRRDLGAAVHHQSEPESGRAA